MRKPKMYDQNDDTCMIVLKCGRTTGLTVGRATTLASYTRKYFANNNIAVSKEWTILFFDKSSSPFSANSDSGSVVVDGAGRVVDILAGGAGIRDSKDITYVTPYPLSWRSSAATSLSLRPTSSRSRQGDESCPPSLSATSSLSSPTLGYP